MLKLTKKQTTEGFVDLSVRVPAHLAERVERAMEALLGLVEVIQEKGAGEGEDERVYTSDEVFPDSAPGEVLRGARYRESLTQEQLAEMIGVKRSHIAEMEAGRRPIGKEMARRLARVFKTSYRVFL